MDQAFNCIDAYQKFPGLLFVPIEGPDSFEVARNQTTVGSDPNLIRVNASNSGFIIIKSVFLPNMRNYSDSIIGVDNHVRYNIGTN